MLINSHKTDQWKQDVALSVDFYNQWFLKFAPQAYKETREATAEKVMNALEVTAYFRNINEAVLIKEPGILSILRMATRPALARDRLIGLSGVSPSLVKTMEKGELPLRMDEAVLTASIRNIAAVLNQLLDDDIFSWIGKNEEPTDAMKLRASIVIADRLCGMVADPIIRNAQEQRQLKLIGAYLDERGYRHVKGGRTLTFETLEPGTYSFRLNVPVTIGDNGHKVNIPVDTVIKPKDPSRQPILIEAKSAGDFTNTNKRRKEEAVKVAQIRATYGPGMPFLLFLCGYFDSGYLGYESAEGIDWIWEHRLSDFDILEL